MKSSDPLVVRKKIELSDTYYRRDCPEHEVVHAELAVDTEICVALVAGVIAAATLMCIVHGWRQRQLRKKYERAICKAKYKT